MIKEEIKNVVRFSSTDLATVGIGKDDTGIFSDLKKAMKFFREYGVNFTRNSDDVNKGITIRLVDVEGVNVKSPLFYEMSIEMLVSLYKKIIKSGINGRLLIQAFTDAIEELDPEVYVGIAHHEGESNGERIVGMYLEYIDGFFKIHNVPHRHMDFRTMNTICLCIGGYKGLRRLFTDAFKKLYIALVNNEEMCKPTYSVCNVCKHCKINVWGEAFCSKCINPVPDNMTANQISSMMHDVKIIDGSMYTSWIFDDKNACRFFKDRRPFKK